MPYSWFETLSCYHVGVRNAPRQALSERGGGCKGARHDRHDHIVNCCLQSINEPFWTRTGRLETTIQSVDSRVQSLSTRDAVYERRRPTYIVLRTRVVCRVPRWDMQCARLHHGARARPTPTLSQETRAPPQSLWRTRRVQLQQYKHDLERITYLGQSVVGA